MAHTYKDIRAFMKTYMISFYKKFNRIKSINSVVIGGVLVDIWEKMHERAKEQYHPEDTSPFVYAHHVVCALEAENGEIFVELCI